MSDLFFPETELLQAGHVRMFMVVSSELRDQCLNWVGRFQVGLVG